MKAGTGISVDQEVVEALEEQISNSSGSPTCSCVIITGTAKAFFRAALGRGAETKELAIIRRNGQLKL